MCGNRDGQDASQDYGQLLECAMLWPRVMMATRVWSFGEAFSNTGEL